jgi:tetratricopeptide (TPR) repeat protein
MSEATETSQPAEPAPKSNRRTAILIVIAIVVVLLPLLYGAGYLLFPLSIHAGYQNKNCGLALGLDNFYTSIYPAVIADPTLMGPVRECAVYTLATGSQEKKAWEDSYNAYTNYATTYPNGLFTAEVHEQTAVVLVAWSDDLLAQKDFETAQANLDLVLKSYKDTSVVSQAGALMPKVYLAWGQDLRGSSDFAGAETTFKALAAWAAAAKQNDSVKNAKQELAQTYLAWALALQADKQFEDAKAKLGLAVSTDPEPLSKTGPAAQARAAQAKLYREWGDNLLENKDFAGAIDRYKTAITLVETKDQPAAKDAVANAYEHWAASLSAGEDFLSALKQVDEAGKIAGTDTGKKAVEAAKTDTYTAFSNSTGAQAQKAMTTIARAACDQTAKSDLPIFGIDKDKILAMIYGVDDRLPEATAARTPGSLHYVACIELTTQRVQTKTFFWATLIREAYTWKVTLRRLPGGEAVATTAFTGGTPPPMPDITRSNYIDILMGNTLQRYRGTNPDVADLSKWLLGVMK